MPPRAGKALYSGTDYTVTSSDSDTVAVERVLTFWVAVAKAEGTAEVTASNSVGAFGTVIPILLI